MSLARYQGVYELIDEFTRQGFKVTFSREHYDHVSVTLAKDGIDISQSVKDDHTSDFYFKDLFKFMEQKHTQLKLKIKNDENKRYN
jgi:hypothetical protein